MSGIGTRIRCGRGTPLSQPVSAAAEASDAKPPYRLLRSTGIVAVVLGIVAFVLWGINGPGILFDMLVAFCT